MTNSKITELPVQLSRKKLWFGLFIMLVTGLKGISVTSFPASAGAALIGRIYFPLQAVLCIAYLLLFFRFRRFSEAGASVAANTVLNDELRRASADRAVRVGFLLMLFAQPVLLLIMTALPPVAHPAALMACASGLIGMVALCSCMLFYDR